MKGLSFAKKALRAAIFVSLNLRPCITLSPKSTFLRSSISCLLFLYSLVALRMTKLLILLLLPIIALGQSQEVLTVTYEPKYQAEAVRFHTASYVIAQSRYKNVTCVAAFDYEAKLKWEVGRCREGHSRVGFDLPLQIRGNKVYFVFNNRLQVRELTTGKLIRRTKVHFQGSSRPNRDYNAKDSIFITSKYIILKNRYTKFWVYTHRLKLVYTSDNFSTGHYPAFKDGKYFIGYRVYDRNFKSFTELPVYRNKTFKCHADSIAVKDNQVLYATSCNMLLVDYVKRKTLLNFGVEHSQKALFLNDKIAVINGRPKELFILQGGIPIFKQSFERNGIYRVKNWLESGEALLVNRVGPGAILLDDNGNKLEEFNFPSEKSFVQHFDLLRDAREEIIMHDYKGFSVFASKVVFSKVLTLKETPRTNFSLYSY